MAKGTVVSAKLPDEELKMLAAMCRGTGRSKNSILLGCIRVSYAHWFKYEGTPEVVSK